MEIIFESGKQASDIKPPVHTGKYRHDCPECGRTIWWALAFCCDCRQPGLARNPGWTPRALRLVSEQAV